MVAILMMRGLCDFCVFRFACFQTFLDQPVGELVLTDRPLQITFVLWGLSAVLVLYLAKFG